MRLFFALALIGILFPSVLLATQAANERSAPAWVVTLQTQLSESLETEVEIHATRVADHVDGEEHAVLRLEGKGSLTDVADPLEAAESVFLSDGWKRDDRYLADGHGSAQRAFRSTGHLCVARVTIDSSDEEDETGHVPSLFWFEIDCRDSGHSLIVP